MDGRKTGTSVNGAQGPKHGENEAKEKMKKTQLLKQQIEENRMRMLQREKEISNSKRNMEQLITQLDRSASGASLNMTMEVEDVRDSKIASLESSVSALKSEKRDLEMKLLSLETIQEAKESLEQEIAQLNTSHENLLAENSSLQARLEKYHELEDENDELKARLDSLTYENSHLKQDVEARDKSIVKLETKLRKVNQELQERGKLADSINIEELERRIHDLTNEKLQLQNECQDLKSKLSTAAPEVKVASLGANKKAKARRVRNSGEDETAQTQLALLASQRDNLEQENNKLKSDLSRLEQRLEEGDEDRRTLQQRIELLMAELSVANTGSTNNDLANVQTLLLEKETECATLSSQLRDVQTQQQGCESELFNLRAKCRDVEYMLSSKEDALRALQLRMDAQTFSNTQTEQLEELVGELETKLATKEDELRRIAEELTHKSDLAVEFERKYLQVNEEKAKLQQEGLQAKLSDTPQCPVKVSSLGSNSKKSRSRRSKGRPTAAESESVQEESGRIVEAPSPDLNERISLLEQENAILKTQESRLAALESQIGTLEEQLASSEAAKRNLQQRVDLLLLEIESSGSQTNDLANVQILLQTKEQECISLASERDEIRQRLEEVEAELFRLRAQYRDAEYLLNSKDQTIHDLQQRSTELEDLREQAADLQAKLSGQAEEKSSSVTRLQTSLREVREELDNAERELSDRSDTIQKLEKSCSSLHKEATEKDAEIQRLKDYIQEAEIVLAEQDAKFKAVQDELNKMKMQADADAQRAAIEEQLNHSQIEKEMLLNDLETRNAQLEECKSVGDELNQQLEALRARETEMQSRLEALDAQKAAAEEKLNQLSDKYKKLAANYKQKLAVIQQLEGKLDKLKKAATESPNEGGEDPQFLRMRLAEAEDELQILRTQLDKLKATADHLTHTQLALTRAESQLKSSEEERQPLMDQVGTLQGVASEFASVKSILEETRQSLSASETQVQSLQEENRALKAQLEEVKDQLNRLETELQLAKEGNQNLTIMVEDGQQALEESRKLLEQLDETSNRANQLQAQLEMETSRNASHVQSMMDQHSALVEELRAGLDAARQSSNDQTDVQPQIQLLEAQLKELSLSRDLLQQDVEEVKNSRELISQDAAAMQQQLVELTQEKEDLAKRVMQLEEELTASRDQLSSSQHRADSLVEDLKDVQQQREQEAGRFSLLEEECTLLRVRTSDLDQELQEVRDQLAAAQWDLETKTNELSSTQRQLQEASERLSQLNEEMIRLSQCGLQNSTADQEMQDLRDQLAAAQWDLEAKASELVTIQRQHQEEAERVFQLKGELAELRQSGTDHSELNREVQELRDQLAAAQWDLDTKTNDLDNVQRQRQQEAERVFQLQEELNEMRQSGSQNSGTEEIEHLRDQLAAAQWDLDIKKGEVANSQQQHERDTERIAHLEEELIQLKQLRAEDVRDQLAAAQWDLDTKSVELSNLQQQHQRELERIAQLEEELHHLRQSNQPGSQTEQEIRNLHEQLGAIQWELESKNNELSNMQHRHQQDVERIAQMEEELNRQPGSPQSIPENEIQHLRDHLAAVQWDLDVKIGELTSVHQQRVAMEQELMELRQQGTIPPTWTDTESGESAMLKTRVLELEQQFADLNNQYAGLYDAYGSKLHEMATLENQVTDATKEKVVAEERSNQLSADIAKMQDALMELEELRAKNYSMETANGHLSSRASELESQLQELNNERDRLRRALDLAEEQKAAMESELESLRKSSEEAASRMASKESECLELSQKLELGASDVQEIGMLRTSIADLAAERDDLSYQLEDYQAQCSALETKLAEADEVRTILESSVAYLESKVSTLQSEVASQAAEVTTLQEERSALNARVDGIDAVNQELSALRLTLEDAERIHKESDAALIEARRLQSENLRRIEDLEQQLSDSLRCLSEEQQKHRMAMDERDELRIRLSEADQLRSERAELLEKISELQQELDKLKSTNKVEEEELEVLRFKLEESKYQVEEVSQLRLSLFEAITEKEELESSIQIKEDELSALRLQLEPAIRAADEVIPLRAELSQAARENEELKSFISRLEEELTCLRNELETGGSVKAEEVAHLRTRLMQTITEKEDLESSVQSLEEELASLRLQMETGQNSTMEEASALRVQLVQMSTDRDELSSAVQSLEDELATLRLESETGRNATVELKARCADLDMERNLLMEKCMELRDSQMALEARYAETERLRLSAETEVSRLQSEHSMAQSVQASSATTPELAQLRVALMDLTAERDDLLERVADADEKLAELVALQVSISELSMERDEALAKVQILEEEQAAETAELKRKIAEHVAKLSQQEERIDRVSVERDQLQQTVLRMESRTEQYPLTASAESSTPELTADVAALHKRIADLEQELHETKIKAAKSLRQVKLLRAEAAKQQKAAGGGEDYFSSAVEEELRKQVANAEKTTAEKVKEIAALMTRIDMLEGANERFLQAKERQDNEVAMLQQRIRELQSKISSLEWDNPETSTKEKEPSQQVITKDQPDSNRDYAEQVAALESTLSQLTDDNEHLQDVLEEFKSERISTETELKARIAALEADLAEKTRLLDEISLQVDNKDRLLSDAYDSVNQLRKQVMQLSDSNGSSAVIEELKRENENLVDMIRQLSTTGTLDAATVQRLKDEIEQNGAASGHPDGHHLLNRSSSSETGELGNIDWHSAFNDLQIEVEYLRSQNAALLNRLQEAGLMWDEEGGEAFEDGDRAEMLRLQLDNAIRNVHERDMRCQELTWEITKLLEERDTLQLRLSNSLRQNHEMQQELKDFTASASSSESDIAAKLRELKQLNYSLDVQLRREQEERQTVERKLMALYGSRGGSTSPYASAGSRNPRSRYHQGDDSSSQAGEQDLNSSQESLGTSQVLSDWLKGKGSVQHI